MADETPETNEAAEASTEEAVQAPEAAVPAEPEELLSPKERRARRRAAGAPEARGPMTQEERTAERLALRKAKAAQRTRYRARLKAKKAELRASQPAPEPTPPVHEHGPGRPRVRQGVVVSDKGEKTITVRIDVVGRHRRYHKILRSSQTLHAHDEGNTAGTGDTVRVIESRPLSRTKRWRLVDVVEKAK